MHMGATDYRELLTFIKATNSLSYSGGHPLKMRLNGFRNVGPVLRAKLLQLDKTPSVHKNPLRHWLPAEPTDGDRRHRHYTEFLGVALADYKYQRLVLLPG